MITREQQLADWQARQDEAASMHVQCPICGSDHTKVDAAHKQATRSEPCKFLGFQGVCIPCQMAFPIEDAQLVLEA